MEQNIVIVWLSAILAAALAGSPGQFIITHTPSHVTFLQEASAIQSSEIPHVIESTFGFTLNKDLKWNGLGKQSLFARPKANVIVSVDSVPRSLNIKHHSKYAVQNDDPVVNTEVVTNKLQSASDPLLVDFSVDSTLFDIKSEHPTLFHKLPSTFPKVRQIFEAGASGFSQVNMGTLNITDDADLLFLGELHVIRELINALKDNPRLTQDSAPDFFHLKIAGLEGLVRKYGKTSSQVRDATNLLEIILDELTAEFRRLYSDNLIIQVVTSAASDSPSQSDKSLHNRKTRSLMAAGDEPAVPVVQDIAKDIGLAKMYSRDYPVMFNIILWFSIAMGLTIFFIAYGMWMMDPGKDSIIYRMTSQRMKKD